MITTFIRIEGPAGLDWIGNIRIISGSDRRGWRRQAARFIHCATHSNPINHCADTPGMMVGPEIEKTGTSSACVADVRERKPRRTIPFFTIVLRKGYASGPLAMAAGSGPGIVLHPLAWPPRAQNSVQWVSRARSSWPIARNFSH